MLASRIFVESNALFSPLSRARDLKTSPAIAMHAPAQIRNVAIVAHIDHGKTTLLDSILRQSNLFRDNEHVPDRVMDSYDQERERGITIFAKQTCVFFEEYKFNLIDTPGHADFAGEVERILGMINSVLLVVDAQDGPMPQTRFVLSKALQMGLCPIVVLNKIDRPSADPDRVLTECFDLFAQLGANDKQLDFSYIYASGLTGFATRELNAPRVDLRPLFELIVEAVPPPSGDAQAPFLMQAATVAYDDFLGRQAAGRILEGQVRKGDALTAIDAQGEQVRGKVNRIQGYLGLQKVEVEEAGVGDIVLIAGFPNISIGDTLRHPESEQVLPPIQLEEPTVSIDFMVNSGPLAGREGKHITINKIRDRLMYEKRANISLRIEESPGVSDIIQVSGRGELHLAVLIEAMRREGFECTLSKPNVVLKQEKGVRLEPIEAVHIDVPEEFSGAVIEQLSRRKGELRSLQTNQHGLTKLEFMMPTRGLIGYRSNFLTMTKGLGVLTSQFFEFQPWKGQIPSRPSGVMISIGSGKVTGYAIFNLQDRGGLFVAPGNEVYEGMVVGEHSRDSDIIVNVTKAKQLTNMRASGKDENVLLIPPRQFTLEQAIEYVQDDELVEVTPTKVRLRKRLLSENARKRAH